MKTILVEWLLLDIEKDSGWESVQLVFYRHVSLLWKTRQKETHSNIFKQVL
jgi:hypothetical protein